MKCHILFSEKNKKNISKCRLLKILPRVLSVKTKRTVFVSSYFKSLYFAKCFISLMSKTKQEHFSVTWHLKCIINIIH